MELAHRWSDRNLTRIEMVMALLILALLIGSFSRYMFMIFARAEQSMMSRTIININTALNYRASMAVMLNQADEIEFLLNMNPLEAMQKKPEVSHFDNKMKNYNLVFSGSSISPPLNYGGILASDAPEFMEKGKWYYQQDANVILYTISNSEFFESEITGLSRIRFRIKLIYKDNNANGHYDLELDEYNAVKLQAIDQYTWNI